MKEVARDNGSSDPDGFSAMILAERSYGCSRLQPTYGIPLLMSMSVICNPFRGGYLLYCLK